MGNSYGYKDDLDQAVKDAPGVGLSVFWIGLVALLVIAGLFFIALKMGIVSMNIQRETVQHSQQYVETKITLLSKLHNDYLQLDTEIAELKTQKDNDEIIVAKKAQQKEIVNRMKEEANRIPESKISDSIKEFLRNR